MRTRTMFTAAAAAVALAAVPAANGATATLTMYPWNGVTPGGDIGGGTQGYLLYGQVFQQEFLVAVTDDLGAPVGTCLGPGGQVRVLNAATGQQVGPAVMCAISDGKFHIFPDPHITTPTDVVAVVDPSTLGSGAVVSSAQSNQAAIRVAPKFLNRSPSINPGTTYPIRGELQGGSVKNTGSLILFKKQGSRLIRKAARPVTRRFEFKVRATGRYRVQYKPKSGNGYVASYMELTIRRI